MEITNNINTLTIHINKKRLKRGVKPVKKAIKISSIITLDIILGLTIAYMCNILYTLQ